MLDKITEKWKALSTWLKNLFSRKDQPQKSHEQESEEEDWTLKDIFWIFLRTLKILTNVLFTLGLVAVIFGSGIAAGDRGNPGKRFRILGNQHQRSGSGSTGSY